MNVKSIIKILTLIIISSLLTSCFVLDKLKALKLTDKKIDQYIAAYNNLKKKMPQLLQEMNKNPQNKDIGKNQFEQINSLIKETGIKDYTEFVLLNAKIGSIFSIIQGEKGMSDFEKLKEKGDKMLSDGEKQLMEQINNPDIPEETKAELKKALEEIRQSTKNISDTYANNTKWANLVMDKVKGVSNLMVDKNDIDVVKRNESKIMQAYTGFTKPYDTGE